MNKPEYIKDLLKAKSNDELKTLILEYKELASTGQLPECSDMRNFGNVIATVFEMTYNLALTKAFIVDEVFDRFLEIK